MRDTNVQNVGSGNVKIQGETIRKNTKITIGGLVIVVFLIFLFFPNFNSIEKRIVGTWQINEQPQIFVTFGENGVFSMSGDGDYLDGDYVFINNNTVQAHIKYLWADFVLSGQISIKGNQMTIENMSDPDDVFGANGVTITLQKTK